jgi:hypothetical protein
MSSHLLSAGLRHSGARLSRRLDRATEDPQAAQLRVLTRILDRNADTAFGRDHQFSEITTAAEYRARVPLRDYEGHRNYVDRAVAGEPNVLTIDSLTMLTMTSGTTAAPKRIPITAEFAAEQAALTRLWTYHALVEHPEAFAGKILMIASPAVEGTTASGVPFGAMSGVAYRRIPRLMRRRYAVPYAVSLIVDPQTRYFVTMRMALEQDITVIATPNATTLLRLADIATQHAEELIRAVHDGTLGVATPTFSSVGDVTAHDAHAEINRSLRPNPERARELARVLATHGSLDPRHCWPRLALIGCWLGGSAGLHASHLAARFGPQVPLRDLGLIASEGRMTVPLCDATAAGPLALDTNFCEFIPEERIDAANPPVLLAHELMDTKRYYIVLTTSSGLYRYDINDIVEVRGFWGRTPQVAFVRKGRDMVNIVGEKLHLNQVQDALRDAAGRAGIDVWQYRLIPDAAACAYDLLVETTPACAAVSQHQGRTFLQAFDDGLALRNVEYAAKRSSGRLAPTTLHLMALGWSETECRRDFDNGKREVQHKWVAIGLAWDDHSRAAVRASFGARDVDLGVVAPMATAG